MNEQPETPSVVRRRGRPPKISPPLTTVAQQMQQPSTASCGANPPEVKTEIQSPALAGNPTNISAPQSVLQEQPPAPASLPEIEDVFPKQEQEKPPEKKASAIAVGDVVQVFNATSPYYGTLFIVGDMQLGKAHGYHMLAGGRKEYVTVGIEECWLIGVSKARSREPVSPQWKMDHKLP